MRVTLVYVFLVISVVSYAEAITFAGPPTPSTTKAPTTTKAPATKCRCVAAGTCKTNVIIGFDFRIVNEGEKKDKNGCTAAQVWCCEGSSEYTDGLCGVRKITNTKAEASGTAKYGDYPWQAALLTETNEYIGSGVLLNENYVLTAAHKVSAYPKRNFKVRLGSWKIQNYAEPYTVQDYKPAAVTTHPSYVEYNLQNDVALIKLDKPVPLLTSPHINCAPLATAVPAAGTRCWVSGWGTNEFNKDAYQTVLKEVDVPIIESGACEKKLRTTRLGNFFILDQTSFMCAGGEVGKDACTGDGGAPLMCQAKNGKWEVVGLTSWGIGCAASTIPGVYVNVPNYRTWINQQMK